jgi:flavodoxin
MKTLITYYSYSGITAKVVEIFSRILEKKSEIKIQRLKPKNEVTSFAAQCIAARLGRRCELEGGILFEANSYDLIIIGLPVWAFAPVPAINTFIDKASGLENKKVIILLTSGSGLGVNMCFKTMRKFLLAKGTREIKEINIPNARMGETNFIVSEMEASVSQI